ncbi:MAG: Uma2 family endonuclease [Chloroflexia bacterium]|nr:Uma2 family endonuclease [Chloroflexia bacterium]
MAVAQRMSEEAYLEIVQSGQEGAWELHDGRLVEKPGMSWDHGRIVTRLISLFDQQLDPAEFLVFTELRVRRPAATIFLPDIMVVPTSYGEPFRGRPGTLAIFADPLPLVVEVWSPSTGDYDVDTTLPAYQQRGDREIWRIHPYERTLTSWRRQPDGSYRETLHREGTIAPVALPGVTIDIAALFDN